MTPLEGRDASSATSRRTCLTVTPRCSAMTLIRRGEVRPQRGARSSVPRASSPPGRDFAAATDRPEVCLGHGQLLARPPLMKIETETRASVRVSVVGPSSSVLYVPPADDGSRSRRSRRHLGSLGEGRSVVAGTSESVRDLPIPPTLSPHVTVIEVNGGQWRILRQSIIPAHLTWSGPSSQRALGRIRTCAHGSGGRCSIP